jgi:hypothetical protein
MQRNVNLNRRPVLVLRLDKSNAAIADILRTEANGVLASVIADNNIELVQFYKELARNPLQVYRAFDAIPRTSSAYYKIRSLISVEENRLTNTKPQ